MRWVCHIYFVLVTFLLLWYIPRTRQYMFNLGFYIQRLRVHDGGERAWQWEQSLHLDREPASWSTSRRQRGDTRNSSRLLKSQGTSQKYTSFSKATHPNPPPTGDQVFKSMWPFSFKSLDIYTS